MPKKIARERIERAARIYPNNEEAGRALGITGGSFSRLCRQYRIKSPQARRLEEQNDE